MLRRLASIFPLLLVMARPLAGAQELADRPRDFRLHSPGAVWDLMPSPAGPCEHRLAPAGRHSANVRSANGPPAGTEESQEFEQLFYVALAAGANWPVGDMNVSFDPSILFLGRVEYALTPTIRAGGQLSFHSFDAELPAIRDNRGVISLSLIGKTYGKWGPYKPFGLLGVGAFWSKEEDSRRRLDGGVQIGAGFELPTTNHLSVTVGTGLQLVFRGDQLEDLLWLDGYVGFVFREP